MPDRKSPLPFINADRIGPYHDPLDDPSTVTQSAMPLDPSLLRSLDKPIAELLGMIFTTPNKTGLPSRLRLTNWDARQGLASLTGLRKGAERMSASPSQLDELIGAGTVDVEQPAAGAVDKVRKLLSERLTGKPQR